MLGDESEERRVAVICDAQYKSHDQRKKEWIDERGEK
jgi:hypothetical protein